VASSLSISLGTVKERLKVFIAMSQISSVPKVAEGGEIRDKHYSLVEEGLKRKDLREFLPQDDATFVLSGDAVERFVTLCHFDQPDRAGSPIKDPREWRPLGKILADEDTEKRADNLRRVMDGKELPSDVWAKRSAELRTLTWEIWLSRLHLRLSKIN